jgi:hypothetical protein
MSFNARAIYRELLDIQWENGCLTRVEQMLNIIGASDQQWQEFAPYLDELFPNGVNPKLDLMRKEAVSFKESRSRAGSKSARVKQVKNKRSTRVQQVINQTETETETEIVDKSTVENDIPEQFITTKGQESWREFVAFRKEINKPLTATATKLITNKLQGFSEEEMIVALETAIEKRWVTVYPKSLPKTELTVTDDTNPYGPGWGVHWGFLPGTDIKEAYDEIGERMIAGVAA